MRYMYCICNTK